MVDFNPQKHSQITRSTDLYWQSRQKHLQDLTEGNEPLPISTTTSHSPTQITEGTRPWNKISRGWKISNLQNTFPLTHHKRAYHIKPTTTLPICHCPSRLKIKRKTDNNKYLYKRRTCLPSLTVSSEQHLTMHHPKKLWAYIQHSCFHLKKSKRGDFLQGARQLRHAHK